MMPTLHRGDILFSTNSDVKIEVKDIVLAQVSKYVLMTPLRPFLLITISLGTNYHLDLTHNNVIISIGPDPTYSF